MESNLAIVQELMKWLTNLVKETFLGGFCVLFLWLFLREKRDHVSTIKGCEKEKAELYEKVYLLQTATNEVLDKAVHAISNGKQDQGKSP